MLVVLRLRLREQPQQPQQPDNPRSITCRKHTPSPFPFTEVAINPTVSFGTAILRVLPQGPGNNLTRQTFLHGANPQWARVQRDRTFGTKAQYRGTRGYERDKSSKCRIQQTHSQKSQQEPMLKTTLKHHDLGIPTMASRRFPVRHSSLAAEHGKGNRDVSSVSKAARGTRLCCMGMASCPRPDSPVGSHKKAPSPVLSTRTRRDEYVKSGLFPLVPLHRGHGALRSSALLVGASPVCGSASAASLPLCHIWSSCSEG